MSLHCFGVLALELAADSAVARTCLDRVGADALGAELALDLQRLLPGVEALDGAFAGAHYDPAELLRPGWPVHAALAELVARLPPATGGRLAVFAAEDDGMPLPVLQPDPALGIGPLRVLPFCLAGEPAQAAAIGQRMEARLLDTGMAAAATALRTQALFGLQLEHARFMSLHDLCALTAMQYRHAGLEPLWRLLEAALLAPDGEETVQDAGEPVARYRDGEVRIAVPAEEPAEARQRRRQYRAVLTAHGIAVRELAAGAGDDPLSVLRDAG